MLSLKCARCGRQIEVSDTLRGIEIACAHCGQILMPVPPADAAFTELGAPPGSPDADGAAGNGDALTENPSFADDTLAPQPPWTGNSFSFLSAARDPQEIGWLGHYRVLRLLGQGGMAFVFEAIDTHLQRTVALKVMKPELAQDEAARHRFLREGRAIASVKSEYIVAIHHVGQHHNVPYLAMELLQGESLERRLQRQKRTSMPEVLRLGIEISLALAAAHEHGLIHRDIKPGNIWLEISPEPAVGSAQSGQSAAARASGQSAGAGGSEKYSSSLPSADCPLPPGSSLPSADCQLPTSSSLPSADCQLPTADCRLPTAHCRVKILDFGLARLTRDQSHLTQRGFIMGTPAYMAPEQAEGKEVDARCDLFSLGSVLYELATGTAPFTGTSSMAIILAVVSKEPRPPREIDPNIPPRLADLILRLLAKDPRDRPESARAVVAALEAIAAPQEAAPSPAPAATPQAQSEPSASRRLSWFLLGLAVLAIVIAGMLLWLR